jgi:hypothetical protein
MKLRIMIAATLLSIALPAAADRAVFQEAYEVALSEIRLPRNENGTIGFKKCESCDYVIKRVNSTTQYKLNGKPIRLVKLRGAISEVANGSKPSAIVLHHLKKDQVTAVSVYL